MKLKIYDNLSMLSELEHSKETDGIFRKNVGARSREYKKDIFTVGIISKREEYSGDSV